MEPRRSSRIRKNDNSETLVEEPEKKQKVTRTTKKVEKKVEKKKPVPKSKISKKIESKGESKSEETTVTEEKEEIQCGICLEDVAVRGVLNSCNHPFCLTCISEWSKTANTCPFCKARFNSLQEIDVKSNKKGKKTKVKEADQHYEYEGPESYVEFDNDFVRQIIGNMLRDRILTGGGLTGSMLPFFPRMPFPFFFDSLFSDGDDEDMDSDDMNSDSDDDSDDMDSDLDDDLPFSHFFEHHHGIFAEGPRLTIDLTGDSDDDDDPIELEPIRSSAPSTSQASSQPSSPGPMRRGHSQSRFDPMARPSNNGSPSSQSRRL